MYNLNTIIIKYGYIASLELEQALKPTKSGLYLRSEIEAYLWS